MQIVLLLTALTLLPAIIMSATPFLRIIVVLHFLRQALGTQTSPSNQVLVGLALFPMRWIYDLLLGILVPAAASRIGRLAAASVGMAVLAPWCLALFPEPLRWPAMVIGLPLAWAVVWLAHLSQSLKSVQRNP